MILGTKTVDMFNKKPVLIHFHIFKNAGSTLEVILKKNFSNDAISMDTESPRGILSWDTIFSYFSNNSPTVKSFSSHQIRFPIPENSDFNFLPVLLVRHPIDRAFSIYSFDIKRKNLKNQISIEKAHNLPVREYFKWNIEHKKFAVMKNFQVRYLASTFSRPDINLDDLNRGIERLKECKVMGTVERFDEVMVFAEEILRPYFNGIDFSYVKKNVNKERKGSLNERLEDARMVIGDTLMYKLEEANKMDFLLYSKANELFDKQLESVDNMSSKLAEFKNRCKKQN